ncbi:MAG: deiodinase-like protein, partial [Aureliella sp.]
MMQRYFRQLACMAVWLLPSLTTAQNLIEREAEFLDTVPLVGELLPEVTVYSADGTPFDTSKLRGHYTVLTFGCLTCPPSMWNISGLEAVHRDYAPKGVEFFFIYKSLAHPELAGNYIQPFTLEERMAHAKQAKEQFNTQIPWVVDAMDNRLKRALGDRPNSQFLIDPQGIIVRKRAWSNPAQVREDLEECVGPVDKITREEDLHLKFSLPLKDKGSRGAIPRIPRTRMTAILTEPIVD